MSNYSILAARALTNYIKNEGEKCEYSGFLLTSVIEVISLQISGNVETIADVNVRQRFTQAIHYIAHLQSLHNNFETNEGTHK